MNLFKPKWKSKNSDKRKLWIEKTNFQIEKNFNILQQLADDDDSDVRYLAELKINEHYHIAKYETFTDPRDGKKYKTIKIGQQIWLAENFNFTDGIPHEPYWDFSDLYGEANAWCYYENKPENGKQYGALYTYAAALKAVPPGWHLPTEQEIETLLNLFGGVGAEGCYGLRHSYFNFLEAGLRTEYSSFGDEFSGFWSATKGRNEYGEFALYCDIDNFYSEAKISSRSRNAGHSVRLIKD